MNKPVLLIDMDEVLVDFYNHPMTPFKEPYDRNYINLQMFKDSFWVNLPALKGAIESVNKLFRSNIFDIYICTKPYNHAAVSYSGKVLWINNHLPLLANKIIMTQNKGMIIGDYLIDDDFRNSHGFKGKFIHFERINKCSEYMWQEITDKLLAGGNY